MMYGEPGANWEEDDTEHEFRAKTKDLLVLQLPGLKFFILEFNSAICEFGTYCIFNFDECEQLKISGKRFPKQGLLRTMSAESVPVNGFGFLADDTVFCWVQLQNHLDSGASGGSDGLKAGMVKKSSMVSKTSALELTKR